MFGLPGSQGLLSLNLSNDGVRGSIGGGGLDMNLGNMWKAAGVGSIFSRNSDMRNSEFNSADELVAGRVLWSDEIDQTSKLLDELMSGDAVLNRGNLTDGVAKTTLTGGVKQIDLSKITEGDLGLMLGVILSHEAMRDGVEGTEQEQAIETFRSVLTHSIVGQMVGNTYGMGSLDAGVIADIKALQSGDMDAFARYALGKFDGTEDNWKLMENGNLAYDGDGWLKDSNGNYILDENDEKIGANGIQGGLADILGISSGEAAAMLYSEKFGTVDTATPWLNDGNNNRAITLENDKYSGIYNNNLTQHNTLNIYNNLVDDSRMSLSADYISKQTELNNTGWWHPFKRSALKDELANMTKYISYGEYKGDNFIQSMPDVTGSSNLTEYPVSTLYGAASTNGRNLTHRGLDLATPIGTELYPFIFNDDTTVFDITPGEDTKQGNHVITKTPLSYTFKGMNMNEDLFTSYLHLNSIDVKRDWDIVSSTLLGRTGNSGLWDGKPYAKHLHIDMYTQNQSPYINYLNMKNNSNSISYGNNNYNDPFLFLDQDLYKIDDDAYSYNF